MKRYAKFSMVGLLGAGVQLAMLAALLTLEIHYLLATALAVETALLHNYTWQINWTWKDRPVETRQGSFLRFHLANGLVSITLNLIWMRLFTGWLGFPPVESNTAAIALCSITNFLMGDRWVFLSRGAARRRAF